MKKVIKKYITWILIGFIMSFAITSITLQASPTYELKGNKNIKGYYEQLLKKTQGLLPLDMQNNTIGERFVYKATYDKQLDDDTIHHQLQSLADDRISIIYQGNNKTTIGWSSPVFIIQIPEKNISLMPKSIKEALAALYGLDNPDSITAEMLHKKGVDIIKVRACGMGMGKNYILPESLRGPFSIAPHGIRWILPEYVDRNEVHEVGDGFWVDKCSIEKCKQSIYLGMFEPSGVRPAKDSQFEGNKMKLIPYGICKYDRYTSHTFEYFISTPMTLEFVENGSLGSYFITAVHSSKKAIVITYVIQSESPEIVETIGRAMEIYGLPLAYYFIERAKFVTKDKKLHHRLKKAIDTLINITEPRTSPYNKSED